MQRTVSRASWLLHLAKLADELISHLGDQEAERPMISKFKSEKEADTSKLARIPVTRGKLSNIKK